MATGVPHIFANVWFLIWRAGLNNDRFMVELMVFKLGSCLLVPGATLSWQGCFQSQGQTTSHLSACFPSVPSQDFFRIVTSHIWHRGVFLGADAYVIRSIPGKLLRPCISQYLTMSAHQLHGGFTFWLLRAGSRYISGQFWPLILRVCYGDYHGPSIALRETKQHWKNQPMSLHARQSCRARTLTQPNWTLVFSEKWRNLPKNGIFVVGSWTKILCGLVTYELFNVWVHFTSFWPCMVIQNWWKVTFSGSSLNHICSSRHRSSLNTEVVAWKRLWQLWQAAQQSISRSGRR